MKNKFLISLCLVFFISCLKNNETKNIINKKQVESINNDSLSYKKIQMLEKIYYVQISLFKDSILNSLDINNLPKIINEKENKDLTKDLQRILKDGDFYSYERMILYDFSYVKDLNYVPFSLYIAEKFKVARAYTEIYYYYTNLNYKIYKKTKKNDSLYIDLMYLSNNERVLALWGLFKAYLLGDLQAGFNLSFYFEKGIYLPKDKEIADILKSQYDNRK